MFSWPWLKRYDAFISYCSADREHVNRMKQFLEAGGGRFFIDTGEIKAGDEWKREIDRAIRKSKRLILFWCCHSANSEWVEYEWRAALSQHKPIAPVKLCLNPIPQDLERFHWVDLMKEAVHNCAHQPPRSPMRLFMLDGRMYPAPEAPEMEMSRPLFKRLRSTLPILSVSVGVALVAWIVTSKTLFDGVLTDWHWPSAVLAVVVVIAVELFHSVFALRLRAVDEDETVARVIRAAVVSRWD